MIIFSKYLIMKQYIPITLLVFFFSLTNCEDVVDCIINVRPELQDKVLAIGFVDELYFDSLSAEVKNDPQDNNYEYYFNVTGRLPKGIEVYYDTFREVTFEGVPKESGRFRITVSVEVVALDAYYYDDFGNEIFDDNLCEDYTSKTYVLAIK